MFVLPTVQQSQEQHYVDEDAEKSSYQPQPRVRQPRRRMEEFVDLPSGEQLRKPLRSYANLISEAILSSPIQKMTLADIYRYIMEHYPYYRHAGTGWQVKTFTIFIFQC